MAKFKYELGTEVKHLITGFTGIVTGRSEFLNGCVRYIVESRELTKDGARVPGEHFDEQELTAGKGKPVKIEFEADRPGGPHREVATGRRARR